MYTVSVEKAIRKGERIRVVGAIAMIATMVLAFTISLQLGYGMGYAFISFGVGIIPGALLGGLYWGYANMKWQLWAFSNVRNVHHLKDMAERGGLMMSEGGFLNTLIYRTKKFDTDWAALQYRFEAPDVENENDLLPGSIRIERSTWGIIKNSTLSFYLIMLPILIFGAIKEEEERWFIVLSIFALALLSILMSLTSFLMLFDKKVFFEVNDEGIRIGREGYFAWDEIKHERVEYLNFGSGNNKTKNLYLTFEYIQIDHSKLIEIGHFKATRFELIDIVHTYRRRHTKKVKSASK